MIQFNLLPDVKLQYLKARYRKRLVVGGSTIISALCLLIFSLLLIFVRAEQPRQLRSVDGKIKESQAKLEKNKDLNKVLTIQNQLASLPKLHDDKVISSRLFDYLTQLTPNAATISNVDIDFAAHTMSIKGNADALGTVNKFADTLKFTTYTVPIASSGEKPTTGKAFSKVVLSSFSVASSTTSNVSGPQANKASYELTLAFDPAIFVNHKVDVASPIKQVELSVPKIISTRSETEKPASLFVPQPKVEPPKEKAN